MPEPKIRNEDIRLYGAKLHDQAHGWNCDCAPSFRAKFDDLAAHVLEALDSDGRLLPPGGEVSTEWRVHHVDNFWREECATEEEARDLFRRVCDLHHRSNGNVFEIIRRRVITTSDGFKATWPWEAAERHPVVSDNSEGGDVPPYDGEPA